VQCMLDTGWSVVDRESWAQHDRVEGSCSWGRCSVELLSSAGEELGPGPAEDMFLRESVNKKERCVLIPQCVFSQEQMLSTEEATTAAFSLPRSMLLLCTSRDEVRPWPSRQERGCLFPCCLWSRLQGYYSQSNSGPGKAQPLELWVPPPFC
jgi:hypothetical protein